MRPNRARILLELAAITTLVVCGLTAQDLGTVEGLARHSTTGEALADVHVTLRPNSARDVVLQATTNEEGRFLFPILKPGRYELDCQKPGFVRYQKWVEVDAGSVRIDARMPPGARVSGRVTLGPGQPAAGVPVEIRVRGGRPRFTAISAADGTFLFDTLPPARYLLSAGGRGASLRRANGYAPPKTPAEDGIRMGWAPVFFPDARSAAEAQALPVKAGIALTDYELRLRPVPVYRVHGTVLDDRGEKIGGAVVELFAADSWFGAEYEATTRPDGSFDLDDVRPGDWSLRATATRNGVALKGNLPLVVSKSDLEQIRLEASPPFSLEGTVERTEPGDNQGKRLVTAVSLDPQDGGANIGPVFHEQGGHLQFDSVYPGRYRVHPMGFVEGWYLEAVYLGDQEVLKQVVDLRPGVPPLRIVYKPQAGSVRGLVDRGAKAHVYLLPADESLWNEQFVRSGTADSDGRFEVGSLRPGEYIAFAFDEKQNTDEFTEPALMRPLLIRGTRIMVRHGEVSEVELKAIPGGIW